MKLVAGLGNPGARYAPTRHNVGWMALEAFATPLAPSWEDRGVFRVARVRYGGDDIVLVEPLTFMNRSGLGVAEAMRLFEIALQDLVVVHDDMDLPLGRVLVKMGGGDAGHKGIRSIIDELGSADFARVRVGIGRPEDPAVKDAVEWVLEPFAPEESDRLAEALRKASDALAAWVTGGVPAAQNRVNRRERPLRRREVVPGDPVEGTPCPGVSPAPGPSDRKEVE